jgi:hypothetical protein
VSVGEDWKNDVCIGWPMCGNVKELRQIIEANDKAHSSAVAD